MNIGVLVKHAFVAEVRPTISGDGKALEKQNLLYEMNDWDRYALEEAIRIKENNGAEVAVISAGKDCDDTLRTCLAMGADRAIKVPFDSMDPWQIAEALCEAIRTEKVDLILAGFQSQDLNNGLVGPIVAAMLNLPCATAVTSLTFEGGKISVTRELEGGFEEKDTLPVPCLLTVQTGINTPRYPSLRGIKKAQSKEITEMPVVPRSPSFEINRLYFPLLKKGKMIQGSPEEVSVKLIDVLKEKGVL